LFINSNLREVYGAPTQRPSVFDINDLGNLILHNYNGLCLILSYPVYICLDKSMTFMY